MPAAGIIPSSPSAQAHCCPGNLIQIQNIHFSLLASSCFIGCATMPALFHLAGHSQWRIYYLDKWLINPLCCKLLCWGHKIEVRQLLPICLTDCRAWLSYLRGLSDPSSISFTSAVFDVKVARQEVRNCSRSQQRLEQKVVVTLNLSYKDIYIF